MASYSKHQLMHSNLLLNIRLISVMSYLSSIEMSSSFIFVLILCTFSNLEAIDFPPDLPRCHRDDPNLNECLIKATEAIRPNLKLGIREFGIPPINPYVVPLVTFEQGSKALNFKMILRNLTIEGLDTYEFTKFDFDPKTLKFELENKFGPLMTASNCHFQGHLLLTNLNGTGRLLLDTEESVYRTVIIGQLEKRDGVDYYKALNISVTTPVKHGGKARFENFSGLNENIVAALNQVLDQNAAELITEILPIFINFVEDFVGSIYTGIFDRFPYDTLMPLST